MKVHAIFNTMLDRLPNFSITAMLISNKGEVCPKLDIVLTKSK